MTLPPADHPIWKLLQALVSLVGLAILVMHGVDGGHAGGVDVEDGAGALGLGAAGHLAYRLLKS